jgi:ribosomal protein L4
MNKPQTKQVVQFLKARDLENKKIIFLAESSYEGQGAILLEKYHVLYLSSRNIFGLRFLPLTVVNGYDVIANQHLIVMNSAVDQLKVLLGGQS